ncbi:THO complex protein 7-like [Bactrocera oleae]|uniref:THO complex protein 7-like n=1 Tax=Bactrocera oleae TaxID=104688 RepID=UPI00387E4D7E
MSNCVMNISADKLNNFIQQSASIEESLELAKRGTEQIRNEIELLKQIQKFHEEYDYLTNALNDKARSKSEITTLKRELFTLVRKRIQLLRIFNKHCDDFKSDMKLMRQLQSSNDFQYEVGDGGSECDDADDINEQVGIRNTTERETWCSENWFSPRSSCTTFV